MMPPMRTLPLRQRIVAIFCIAMLLLAGVVGGSLGLLWQRSAAQLAESQRETVQARWDLALEQSATLYEAVAIPLAVELDRSGALGQFDRESLRQKLLAAMRSAIALAPITRIDLADDTGIIASTAGMVGTPLVDVESAGLALSRTYAVVGPERLANGQWVFVVTVPGPGDTLLSVASDLGALLPSLAEAQHAEMFLLDIGHGGQAQKLAVSTDPAMWPLLGGATETGDTFLRRIDEREFMAVPLPLHNSRGARIGQLIVVSDVTRAWQRTRLILLTGGVVSLLLVIGAAVVVYAFTREALDPLAEITRVVLTLAGGNLFVRPRLRQPPAEIAAIASAIDVFRANAMELDRRETRETLRDAQNYALIHREMSRLAHSLEEPAREEVLAGLRHAEAEAGAEGSRRGGAAALAAGFQLMTKRVTEQHRQLAELLRARTQDLQIVSQALAEREQLGRLREELEFARHLQMSSLPTTFPAFPDRHDFTIFASMTPANEVGGDFYDFILLEEKRLALLIGDASGKGVSAAMFVATCRALLRSSLVRGASPAEALLATNAAVTIDARTSMFATAFVALLDLGSGRLQYANAGHNPPYLRRAGGMLTMLDRARGIALGVMEPAEFDECEVMLATGETLFLFTDGVTEAYDPAREFYGEARLEAVLRASGTREAEAVVQQVAKDVTSFVRGETQADDITMLAVTYLGSQAGNVPVYGERGRGCANHA